MPPQPHPLPPSPFARNSLPPSSSSSASIHLHFLLDLDLARLGSRSHSVGARARARAQRLVLCVPARSYRRSSTNMHYQLAKAPRWRPCEVHTVCSVHDRMTVYHHSHWLQADSSSSSLHEPVQTNVATCTYTVTPRDKHMGRWYLWQPRA